MSPLPRLHHHDIVTIVAHICTVCYNTSCNVGALKTVQCSAVAAVRCS